MHQDVAKSVKIPKSHIPVLNHACVSKNDERFYITTNDLDKENTQNFQSFECKFPDTDKVWPTEDEKKEALTLDCECGTWMELLARASSHYLTVSVMPFQDAWNIDFDRIMKCCIHVVTPEKKLIPFCVFNITSVDGKSLYRHEIGKKFAKKIIV